MLLPRSDSGFNETERRVSPSTPAVLDFIPGDLSNGRKAQGKCGRLYRTLERPRASDLALLLGKTKGYLAMMRDQSHAVFSLCVSHERRTPKTRKHEKTGVWRGMTRVWRDVSGQRGSGYLRIGSCLWRRRRQPRRLPVAALVNEEFTFPLTFDNGGGPGDVG